MTFYYLCEALKSECKKVQMTWAHHEVSFVSFCDFSGMLDRKVGSKRLKIAHKSCKVILQ